MTSISNNRYFMRRSERNIKSLQNKRRHSAPASSSTYMGRFSQAPKFLQDNEHIIEGYRIGFNSPKKVIKSLFMVHNETVNIWTHLLGAIIFIFLIFEGIAYKMEQSHVLGRALIQDTVKPYKQPTFPQGEGLENICALLNQDLGQGQQPFQCTMIPKEEMNSQQNKQEQYQGYDNTIPTWPIIMGLLGGSICLSCSAVYHWIHPMSEKVFKNSLRLDFAGIGINMAFSPIPAFYYTFYCNWDAAFFYIAINIILGTTSFISNMFDWIHRQENALLKFSILTLSSICCAVGVVHILINQFYYSNFGDTYSMVPTLYFYIPTLLSYAIGFIFYITRCPQRRHPGRYDICGHSHQIWHVFVFLAIAFNYLGSIASYELRSSHSTCPVAFSQQFQ